MRLLQQTNTVYFSNLLPEAYPTEFSELHALIRNAGYKVKLLRATHDFYCRDYMPVQLSKKAFVQFIFRPKAYIKEVWYEEITNPVVVELVNNLMQARFSNLVLDGGNIIRYGNKSIVSSRVLKDNRHQFEDDATIIKQLATDLQSEIIVIPEYPNEETGHADGLIRFIDENSVFINRISKEPSVWLNNFLKVLEENKLAFVELPSEVSETMDTAEGLYLDLLQVGKLIIVPQFGIAKSDKEAVETITKAYDPDYTIVPFKANWLAQHGGVFNGAAWVVYE